ncbi:MAG: biopolymer transporter ExbD [Planctomycetaceae bacterium]|nr:biopolymer transporter ExbD [Planctomycetaceae bacterium]
MRIKLTKLSVREVDMTPMIDIVFQLIAFFMVINNFEQSQVDERVKLPRDQLARPREDVAEDNVVLNIGYIRDKEGNITSQPLVFYLGEQTPLLEFGPVIQREARVLQRLDQKIGETTVEIRADGEVDTGQIQEVIRMAQDAGFLKFTLKAMQGDQEP